MVPCPRCGEPLDLDQGWCQHCRSERLRWLTVLLKFGGLGLLIVLALGLWQRQAVEEAWTEFTAQIDQARNPHIRGVNDNAPLPSPAPSPVVVPIATSTFVFIAGLSDPPIARPLRTTPRHAQDPASAAEPPAEVPNATPPPEPGPITADERRFYGVVYDALTLKPVAGARLSFTMNGNEHALIATTNARGHYQADLFINTVDRVAVSISIKVPPGYRDGLIEDKDPPVRERVLSARRRLIEETSPDELEPVLVYVHDAHRLVALDLVLIPVIQRAKMSAE